LRSSSRALPPITLAQLIGDKTNDVLLGTKRLKDFLPERARLDVLDKVANDFDIDVGFEQGKADLAHRFVDVALGNPALAAESLEDSFEPVAEGLKHTLV